MEIPSNDTIRDAGLLGFCVLLFKEGIALISKLSGSKEASDSQVWHRLEIAVARLTEAVENQTEMFSESYKALNNILTAMHKEQVDQKATLAKLEARQEHKWHRN